MGCEGHLPRRAVPTNEGSYVDIVGFEVTAPHATEGIDSAGATSVRVLGNHVHDVAANVDCDDNGGAAIEFADYSSTDNEASGNLVHDIGPEEGCAFIHGIYMSQARRVMSNNIVYQAGTWCLHLWHGAPEMTVTNNLAFSCGSSGKAGPAGGVSRSFRGRESAERDPPVPPPTPGRCRPWVTSVARRCQDHAGGRRMPACVACRAMGER